MPLTAPFQPALGRLAVRCADINTRLFLTLFGSEAAETPRRRSITGNSSENPPCCRRSRNKGGICASPYYFGLDQDKSMVTTAYFISLINIFYDYRLERFFG